VVNNNWRYYRANSPEIYPRIIEVLWKQQSGEPASGAKGAKAKLEQLKARNPKAAPRIETNSHGPKRKHEILSTKLETNSKR